MGVIEIGWCQYIIVDDWKMKFVISRNLHADDVEYICELIDKIKNSVEELPIEAFEEKYRDITLQSMADYISIAKDTSSLFSMVDWYLNDYIFMRFLKDRNIPYRVVSEFELDKEDEPARDYKTIER